MPYSKESAIPIEEGVKYLLKEIREILDFLSENKHFMTLSKVKPYLDELGSVDTAKMAFELLLEQTESGVNERLMKKSFAVHRILEIIKTEHNGEVDRDSLSRWQQNLFVLTADYVLIDKIEPPKNTNSDGKGLMASALDEAKQEVLEQVSEHLLTSSNKAGVKNPSSKPEQEHAQSVGTTVNPTAAIPIGFSTVTSVGYTLISAKRFSFKFDNREFKKYQKLMRKYQQLSSELERNEKRIGTNLECVIKLKQEYSELEYALKEKWSESNYPKLQDNKKRMTRLAERINELERESVELAMSVEKGKEQMQGIICAVVEGKHALREKAGQISTSFKHAWRKEIDLHTRGRSLFLVNSLSEVKKGIKTDMHHIMRKQTEIFEKVKRFKSNYLGYFDNLWSANNPLFTQHDLSHALVHFDCIEELDSIKSDLKQLTDQIPDEKQFFHQNCKVQQMIFNDSRFGSEGVIQLKQHIQDSVSQAISHLQKQIAALTQYGHQIKQTRMKAVVKNLIEFFKGNCLELDMKKTDFDFMYKDLSTIIPHFPDSYDALLRIVEDHKDRYQNQQANVAGLN